VDHSTLPQDFVEGMLNDKDIIYSTTPLAFQRFSDFMARIRSIGTTPQSWKDLFFPDIYDKLGS
jgi:NitT/TauT family transport system substrate-binding protein